MTVELLNRARSAGLVLRVEGGGLVVSGPTPSADLLADLRAHKAELLALLAANDRDGWSLTAADRAMGSARLNARVEPAPELTEPECGRLQVLNRKIADGYLQAALQRPPSWSDPTALPSPGSFCACCKRQSWWCEREAPKGWRCVTCHPPSHLSADATRTVQT